MVMVGVPGIDMDELDGFEGGYHVQGFAIGYGKGYEFACLGTDLAKVLFKDPLEGFDVIVTGPPIVMDVICVLADVGALKPFGGL